MTIIIGAGAAGLLAAAAAVRQGKTVHIYEKMDRPGIKLGLAGGGRCNISNTGDLMAGLHGTRFLLPALTDMDTESLKSFLDSIGIGTRADEYGRVYPRAMKGREFVQHLHTWLEQHGVKFHFNSPLTGIDTEHGALRAVEIRCSKVQCARAIITCGGNTWPKSGSNGEVAAILAQEGHSILPLLPALTPLKTREEWPAAVKGISLDAGVTIAGNGKKLEQARGNLLFTHFGLSGPVILDISHAAAKALHAGQSVQAILDLLPDLSAQETLDLLEQERQKTLSNALGSLLPSQLAKKLGSDEYIKGLAPSTLAKLVGGYKETRLDIVDVLGKNHAMVSQGGVSLREVNPRTMESGRIQGLFIAGEILAYHGKTGGYNLHAAFATGWLAGKSATGDAYAGAEKRPQQLIKK